MTDTNPAEQYNYFFYPNTEVLRCMNCDNLSIEFFYFHLPCNEIVRMCSHCSHGLYHCHDCRHIVSHTNDNYRQMVYIGPENTFDDRYILCEDCAYYRTNNDNDTDSDTSSVCEKWICEEQDLLDCSTLPLQ